MDHQFQDETVVTRLRFATSRLYRRMREESDASAGLTPNQHSALQTVDAEGSMRMTDLALVERVSKSSITRIVGNLSDLELVELVPDARDGRSTLVSATPAGKQYLREVSERTEAFLARQLSTFTEAELMMLEASVVLLERLAAPGDREPSRPAWAASYLPETVPQPSA